MTNQNAADIFVVSFVVMIASVAFIVFGIYVALPCAIVFGIYKLFQYLTRPKPPTTQELYEHAQVTYFPSDADFTKNLMEKLLEDDTWDECPTDAILDNIINISRQLYRSENLALTPILAPREGTLEEARYRDQLINQSTRATNPLAIIDLIQSTLIASINVFIKALPPAAFTEDEPKYTIPLKDTLLNLPKLVQEITYPFFQQSLYDAGLFKGLRQRLIANGDAVNEKKVVMPQDYKGDDIIGTYLGGTPLEQLFSAQIPIVIPQEAYFEGQWIVAPLGAGKTQFIQSQIVDLLDKHVSIIVMDSQEQLIANIMRLSAIKERS
ncbi:MAG: hypothetical protein ACR2KT_02575 [Methylocella sp.]|nr:MAG: hypothetical protein DLM68_03000 [Hyphomicrobiales bacterium]